MATTPSGRSWCVKALHPSDPVTDVQGVPDECSSPTVLLQYNQVYRVTPDPSITTSNWGFDLTVIPNLLAPGCVVVRDSVGTIPANGLYNFLNQAFRPPGISVPTYAQLLAQFRTLGIESHRLVYLGVTGYQDGPALADQGTLVAAQWEVARRKFVYGAGSGSGLFFGTQRGARYQVNDTADYGTLQFMPNAYFGASKEGVYLPLKLTSNHQKWVSSADLEGTITGWNGVNDQTVVAYTSPGLTKIPPFPSLETTYVTSTPTSVSFDGDLTYKPLNGQWGGISCRNLSVQTSFAFYVRMGIEVRVSPDSMLASQQRVSPPYDPLAIASYHRISRELKDAYPADFNDLGKIWEVIKNVARVALPVVGSFGPIGAGISGVGNAIIGAVDAVRGGKGGNSPSAATVQRAQDAQTAVNAIANTPGLKVISRPISAPKLTKAKKKTLMKKRK